MSNVKALPSNGFANCNKDVADFLREMANNVEADQIGNVRQVMLTLEHDSELDTYVAGGPCDNARVIGLMHMALHKFTRLAE